MVRAAEHARAAERDRLSGGFFGGAVHAASGTGGAKGGAAAGDEAAGRA